MDRATPSSAAAARFAAKLSEVEEDLAKLRGAKEDMRASSPADSQQQQPDTEEATAATSQDGLATVHTNSRGEVVLVELDNSRYNGVDDRDLCGAVLHARTRARSQSMPQRGPTTATRPRRGA